MPWNPPVEPSTPCSAEHFCLKWLPFSPCVPCLATQICALAHFVPEIAAEKWPVWPMMMVVCTSTTLAHMSSTTPIDPSHPFSNESLSFLDIYSFDYWAKTGCLDILNWGGRLQLWKILLIKCRIFIISFSSVISERLSRRKDYLTFCSRLTFSGSPQICSYLCFCRGFHSCATEGPLIARGISTSLSPSRSRGFGKASIHREAGAKQCRNTNTRRIQMFTHTPV